MESLMSVDPQKASTSNKNTAKTVPVPSIDMQKHFSELSHEIKAAVDRVLESGQYIMGPEVKELEDKLAAFVCVHHCISCSSGTDALLIALLAPDIGPADDVITVPYTWISPAAVSALLHAKPVSLDYHPDTFNLSP